MEFFEKIEAYCQNELSKELKKAFETELHKNPQLRKEVELFKEVQDAIMESDVLALRDKLSKVVEQDINTGSDINVFELTDDFTDIHEISEVLTSEELINFYEESLPKVHAYHHETTSNENIHQFYKEQQKSELNNEAEDFEDLDFDMEFEGLEEAILEKDILSLRQTLQQVAKSVEPQYSVEEIDDFINGELTAEQLMEFEDELRQNKSLKEEVQLHMELENSIKESDIMNLRGKLANIIETETSWNVSEESIEEFIDGTLEGAGLEEFLAEYRDNTDLKAEVRLRKEINELLGETDIAALRSELNIAKEKAEVKKVKMLIPEAKVNNLNFWKASVAVIVLLIGISGVLRNGIVTPEKLFNKYYESPVWSSERTITTEADLLQGAIMAYNKSDWEKSYNILLNAEVGDKWKPVQQFYMAANLQNLGKYKEAISYYTQVIEDGDNQYVEEAEWFRSLCYLKTDEDEAKQQLLAVIERKGFYEKDAKAILRRLKYTFR